MDSERNLVSVQIEAGEQFRAGAPEPLFPIPDGIAFGDLSLFYDITPDDQRFVMVGAVGAGTDEDAGPNTVLVTNFFEELMARVPR